MGYNFCPMCGKKVTDTSFKFCPECGFKFDLADEVIENNSQDSVNKQHIKNPLDYNQKEKEELDNWIGNNGETLEEKVKALEKDIKKLEDIKLEEGIKKISQEQMDVVEVTRSNFVELLAQGKIRVASVNSPVVLKRNEESYLALPNIILSEPRSVRVSNRTGYGYSYRIAKGFGVHSNQGKSTSVSHDEIMAVDIGAFVLTNKRIAFIGSQKSININLKKIMSFNSFDNGIVIQMDNKQKVQYFSGMDKFNFSVDIKGQTQTFQMKSHILRAAILGQIAKLG